MKFPVSLNGASNYATPLDPQLIQQGVDVLKALNDRATAPFGTITEVVAISAAGLTANYGQASPYFTGYTSALFIGTVNTQDSSDTGNIFGVYTPTNNFGNIEGTTVRCYTSPQNLICFPKLKDVDTGFGILTFRVVMKGIFLLIK